MTAGDVEDVPGDVLGLVRAEEADGDGDSLRTTDAGKRSLRDEVRPHLGCTVI